MIYLNVVLCFLCLGFFILVLWTYTFHQILKIWYLFLQISLFSVPSSPSGTVIVYIFDYQVSQICPFISAFFLPCGVYLVGFYCCMFQFNSLFFSNISYTLILFNVFLFTNI